MQLSRGQYRISALVPYDDEIAIHEREIPLAVPLADEFKRLYVYKLSLMPTDEEHDGQRLARVTIVFHVIDNPIWLPAAFWAATAAISTVGGWFLIDKVEKFEPTGLGGILSLAAAAGGLLLVWKTFAD